MKVSWTDSTGHNRQLGQMVNFQPLTAKNKRATLNQTVRFQISDTNAFGEFTSTLITQPNFTWQLTCPNLQVNADKFPAATKLHFSKQLTLNGECCVALLHVFWQPFIGASDVFGLTLGSHVLFIFFFGQVLITFKIMSICSTLLCVYIFMFFFIFLFLMFLMPLFFFFFSL